MEEKGWELTLRFKDKVGASRYSATVRDGWDEVREAVTARAFDVLVLWEQSRGDREPGEWLAFLKQCRDAGILIHIYIDDQTYDPRKARDYKTLASAGIDSAYEVDLLSERAKSGIAAAAAEGRPHGGRHAPYGYKVVFDPETGERGYEVDPVTGPIATDIITRLSKAQPIREIIRSLEERGIPGPTGKGWYRHRVRLIGLNAVYLGVRVHNGERHAGVWPALTDPETFAAAGRVLTEPTRLKSGRHSTVGRYKNLLTNIATCTKCEGGMRAFKDVYGCAGGHVWIKREGVDDLISELAILRLSSPDLYGELAQASEAADETLKAARAAAAALRQRLDGFREKAVEGEIEPESFAAIEAGLLRKIRAAEQKIEAATVPADLAGWVGAEADVRARWTGATVGARRIVIKALRLQVQICPAGGKRGVPVEDRVTVSWA